MTIIIKEWTWVDNENNNKELNMIKKKKKYLMEMEKLKEEYNKQLEDDMKEKSIKLE